MVRLVERLDLLGLEGEAPLGHGVLLTKRKDVREDVLVEALAELAVLERLLAAL